MNTNTHPAHSHLQRYVDIWLAALILVVGFLPIVALDNQLMAATYSHNPYGSADYCALENGQTVLYGWAFDPDTGSGSNPYASISAGNASAKVPSNISGYRDSYVNTYVKNHNPGAPTNSTYGWRWVTSGFTQGNTYAVGGNVLNYGAGGNDPALMINTSRFSGMSSSQYPFTSSRTIPTACLAPKPAPPTPPTPSTPTPTTPSPTNPTPTTHTSPPKTSTRTSSSASSTPTAPTAPPAPAASEITVTAGTTTALLALPSGGASTVTVHYGPTPQILTQTASTANVTGTTATVTLRNLLPKATYSYTVSRTVNNLTSTSPVGSLNTKGYELKFQFVDGKGKPVADIHGNIGKTQVTSDKQGFVTFNNMDAGDHTLTFSYQGTKYNETIKTSDAKSASDGQVLSAQKVIDLSNVHVTAGVAPVHSSSKTPLILSGIIMLLGGGLLVAWIFMRRHGSLATPSPSPYSDPLVMHKVSSAKPSRQEPLPAHAGQSLASMVMEAMQQEQAAKQAPQTAAESPQNDRDNTPPTNPPSVPPPMVPPAQS